MLGSTHGTLTTHGRRTPTDGPHPSPTPGKTSDPGTDVDVSGRPLHRQVPDLARLLRPRSVAVTGAADTEGDPAAEPTRQLFTWAEHIGARLYPVHPTRDQVRQLPCVASVSALPERVDLAVLLHPDPRRLSADLAQLSAAQVEFALLVTDPTATDATAEAAASAVREARTLHRPVPRLLGPLPAGPDLFAPLRDELPGPGVALVTGSAEQARPLLGLQDLGVRVSHWAATGAQVDLDAADLLAHLAGRPEVGAVVCCLDRVRDGRALLLSADHAARLGVPVVALRTEADSPQLDAALRQFGVIRVDDPDRLRDTAALFARSRPAHHDGQLAPPQAEGVAVHAQSPYAAAQFADLATRAGLPLTPPPRTPSVEALLADPAVGTLVCPIDSPRPGTDQLVRTLVTAAERTDKLVCVVWGSPLGAEPAYRTTLLGSSRVATFRTFAGCVTALRARLDHRRFVTGYRSPFDEAPRTPSPSLRKADHLMLPGTRLSEHSAKQLLRAYGIRVPREQLVGSAAAAVRAAAQVGYPVALKASGPRLAHRSDRGLVLLGLTSASQVRDGYRELTETARYEGVDLDGVLVCQLVERGVELAVQVAQDPVFGPTLSVSLGGVMAEALPGEAVAVPPFGEERVRAMLDGLTGRPLLDGVRGGPPADLDALTEVVLRVQRLALELDGRLAELAIDPLLVLPRGQGAVAVGAAAVCA